MRWIFKGHVLEGHTVIHDIPVSIENRSHSIRSGVDPDGNAWETRMPVAYGKIPYAVGADGDSLDVFIGPYPMSEKVFIVQINRKGTDKYDEDKVFLGFERRIDVFRTFQSVYDNPRQFFRKMIETDIKRFSGLVQAMKTGNEKWVKLIRSEMGLDG